MVCQRSPRKPKGVAAPLQNLPPTDKPWYRIGMDFMVDFPRTAKGYKHVLTITDYATRTAMLIPMKDMRATSVVDVLVHDVFLKKGVPVEILTDQGPNFMSETVKDLYLMNGVKMLRTTAYHPQTNGLCERFNQTACRRVMTMVKEDQRNWDDAMDYVALSYNASTQSSTGYSPYFLDHGRAVRLPLDFLMAGDRALEEYASISDRVYDTMVTLRRAFDQALEHNKITQADQKRRYDKELNETHYREGDLVWLFNPGMRVKYQEELKPVKMKIAYPWCGPFTVSKVFEPVDVEIVPVEEPDKEPRKVHVSQLKPFLSSDWETNQDTTPEEIRSLPDSPKHVPTRPGAVTRSMTRKATRQADVDIGHLVHAYSACFANFKFRASRATVLEHFVQVGPRPATWIGRSSP